MVNRAVSHSRVTLAIAGALLLALVCAALVWFHGAPPVRAALVPPAPAAPVALAGESAATVFWTAPAAGVTSYTVQASPGGASATVSGSTLSATVGGLVDGTAYTFTVTAANSTGPSAASPASNQVVAGLGAFQPLQPARILDTRTTAPLGPGAVLNVQVTGQGGVPAGGVSAVVLNATVTATTSAGYLTLWPAGTPRPPTSNLNWKAGQTVPTLVEIAIGAGGRVSAFNGLGSADLILDVEGYVADATATPPAAGLYNPVVPSRVLDTRIGLGSAKAQLCIGQTITVTIAGVGGVPATGVSAVVINFSATNTIVAPSAWTIFPAGAARPLASDLNFVPGQTVANRMIVKLGTGGAISIYNQFGHADVVGDVNGWFTDGTGATTGARFVGIQPARILDTRSTSPLAAGVPAALAVAGQGGVPGTAAAVPPTAVVLSVTVTDPAGAGYVTVWPAGAAVPATSDINYVAGLTVPNLVVVKLGASGAIDLLASAASTDVIVDVVGWYG